MNGQCDYLAHAITIREGLAVVQQSKTLAHANLHDPTTFDGPPDQAELEAESVAYVVAGMLGLDGAQYSWGYLASWGAKPDAIRKSGQRIQRTANAILDAIGVNDQSGV